MFRHKSLDVITLFHKPSLPASSRALNLLKQASSEASETATEDQASDHTSHSKAQRSEFELDVTESAPTPDQLKSILEYVGGSGAVGGSGKPSDIIQGARDQADAVKKLQEDGGKESFLRPVVVDWNNGKAVIGGNESAILKMIRELPT
ncbi:hypothetical protein FQN54_008784 [Arachnomyces sp. PD_36]|nr:hypothetical protein FQN54_008784 [Arachnomyces sp. PD_36]